MTAPDRYRQAHPTAPMVGEDWPPVPPRWRRAQPVIAFTVGAALVLGSAVALLALGGLVGAVFGWDMGPVR